MTHGSDIGPETEPGRPRAAVLRRDFRLPPSNHRKNCSRNSSNSMKDVPQQYRGQNLTMLDESQKYSSFSICGLVIQFLAKFYSENDRENWESATTI
jgi:hypothetical protein